MFCQSDDQKLPFPAEKKGNSVATLWGKYIKISLQQIWVNEYPLITNRGDQPNIIVCKSMNFLLQRIC